MVTGELKSQVDKIWEPFWTGDIMYGFSKATLNATTKSLAIDFQTDRIGVLIFHPSGTQTDTSGSSASIDTKPSVIGMFI